MIRKEERDKEEEQGKKEHKKNRWIKLSPLSFATAERRRAKMLELAKEQKTAAEDLARETRGAMVSVTVLALWLLQLPRPRSLNPFYTGL